MHVSGVHVCAYTNTCHPLHLLWCTTANTLWNTVNCYSAHKKRAPIGTQNPCYRFPFLISNTGSYLLASPPCPFTNEELTLHHYNAFLGQVCNPGNPASTLGSTGRELSSGVCHAHCTSHNTSNLLPSCYVLSLSHSCQQQLSKCSLAFQDSCLLPRNHTKHWRF